MLNCTYTYGTTTPDQILSSDCSFSTTTPAVIGTSTDILILPTMTAGEVLIAFLLLALIIIKLTQAQISALRGVNLRKKHLAYSGGDVEIREDV